MDPTKPIGLESFKVSRLLELVKYLEGAIEEQNVNIEELIKTPSNLLFDAAKLENFEFLADLICSYHDLVHLLDEQERSIFHIAILHLHTDIFNLIYGIGFDKELLATYKDNEKNTILHLVAKYTNPPPVSNLPGLALEMQQKLLMFEVTFSPSPLFSIFHFFSIYNCLLLQC